MSAETTSFLTLETQEAVRELTESLRGPVYASLLVLAFDSGLFSLLDEAPRMTDEVVASLGWQPAPADAVLNALVRSGYLTRDGKRRLRCSPKIKALLRDFEIVQGIIGDWRLVYEDLRLLSDVLASGSLEKCKLYRRWSYKDSERAALNMGDVSAYSEDMDSSSKVLSAMLLDAVDLSGFPTLLDVGGGYGEFAVQACERYPYLKAAVFDLPQVREGFEIKVRQRGMKGRVMLFNGDFLNDPLPEFAEIITLNRVLWDWQDDEPGARKILRGVYKALASGGQVLIYEGMYTGDQYLDRLRAATAIQHMFLGGKTRSLEEVISLLQEAGFDGLYTLDTKLPSYRVVIGRRP